MKKIVSLFVLLLLCIGFVSAQDQINPMQLPKLTQRVTDFSTVMTPYQIDNMNTTAKSYEDETSNQLFVVLFPHRQGNELIDIGMKIFTDNGIGQKNKNNGLLLLISTEEKKIRIIVGYGLEGVYPDLIASQIIENDIRPLVDAGDFYGAVSVFYEKSKQVIAGEYATQLSDSSILTSVVFPILFIFVFGIIGFVSARSFYRRQHKKYSEAKQKRMKRWIIILVISPFFLAIISLLLFLLNLFGSGMIGFMTLFNFVTFVTGLGGIMKFGNSGGGGMGYIPGKGWRSGGGGSGGGRSSGSGGGGSSSSSSSGGGGGGSSGGGGAGD